MVINRFLDFNLSRVSGYINKIKSIKLLVLSLVNLFKILLGFVFSRRMVIVRGIVNVM